MVQINFFLKKIFSARLLKCFCSLTFLLNGYISGVVRQREWLYFLLRISVLYINYM